MTIIEWDYQLLVSQPQTRHKAFKSKIPTFPQISLPGILSQCQRGDHQVCGDSPCWRGDRSSSWCGGYVGLK